MTKNKEISDILGKIADILELKDENVFKIRAYRKASKTIMELSEDISEIEKRGELNKIEGIGKGLSEKIQEYLANEKIEEYQELILEIPEGVIELLEIQNLGPRTLYEIYKKFKIQNLNDLEKLIEDGKLLELPGMGDKKIENIKTGIFFYKTGKKRISIGIALPLAEEISELVKDKAENLSISGSLRRMQDTVGDIDILVASNERGKVIDAFVGSPLVKKILAKGDTKASIIIKTNDLQVDLRVVGIDSYGAALQYFTGSVAHNIKVRKLAKDKGLKINEYGVFKGEEYIAGANEKEIYSLLGLSWIPPELREDRGEIEASAKGLLPNFIELVDIKGELHTHSNYSDGINDIKTIALEAKKIGYKYIGIADHSKSSRIAGGMSEESLKKRNEEIDIVQSEVSDIKILKGIEVDILSEGQLDYPDEILEKLDYVIAAIHQGFSKNVGMRMKKAMDNHLVDVIAHPTGRLLSGRKGYEVDIDEIIEYAAEKNVALEINSSFDRLDLNDLNILKGKSVGAKFLISTDLHRIKMFKEIRYGVGLARRGWLERSDVINTYGWDVIPLKRRMG
ncbi:DNA polymerase/3'-5' exonuclease PolX [bacterium]|nr:DNA polymerase/3'-5' exonuclease PolX [bacterium]